MNESSIRKAELAWKKWQDRAVGKEEKAGIKDTIDKLLAKNVGWRMDWKTGKVSMASQQASTNAKTEAKAKANVTDGWTTSDLAAHVSKVTGKAWTTKMLRRYLRQMDEYNDGRMTHYRWTGPQDAMVKKVVDFVLGKAGKTA